MSEGVQAPKNKPFQLNRRYWGFRLGGTGAGGGNLGRANRAFKGGGFIGGGPELHIDICKANNYDPDSSEFVGTCGSFGYGSLWDGVSRTDRFSGAFHIFVWDGQLAVPIGASFFHRGFKSGRHDLGADINVGAIYRFVPPFGTTKKGNKHRVIPYFGGLILLGGSGATDASAGSFHAGLQLSAGVEFGMF